MDNIYSIDEHYKLLKLQDDYEKGLIDEDDLTIEEINKLINLYRYQTKEIYEGIKKKLLYKKEV